jgi:SNF2 family DNA or RNA helicase
MSNEKEYLDKKNKNVSQSEQNMNLEINGRLFPSWISLNFKSYELPEIFRKEGEDPCNEKIKKEVTTYQAFLAQFLNYTSPFRDILVYHGLGSGKTVSAIHIYNTLYNYTPKWNVFLLIKASLKNDPWMKDLNEWIESNDRDNRMKNLHFIHYDSPFADRDFLETVKKTDSSRESLYIVDESHNFIRNVYSNISAKKGKRAQVIYDYIQQEKRDNNKTRIVLLSATPVVNKPYEFALIFNLLRPGSFPTSESIFNQIYISSTNYDSLNENKKNQFQRRIMGLVSYYIGSTPDKYAKKTNHYINLTMGPYQEEVYNHFEKIEEEKEKLRRKMSRGKVGGDDMSTYASYTRQACNFVFPNISGDITGDKRPRPGQFRISDKDALIIDEGKSKEKIEYIKLSSDMVALYIKTIKSFVNQTIEYFKDKLRKDKESGHTLTNDIMDFFEKYDSDFTKLIEGKKHSSLFDSMYSCSPKMLNIIFNILKSPGSVLVYSNYVEMEGLQMFKVYLDFFGYSSININDNIDLIDKKKNGFRYCEFHGGIDRDLREKNKQLFNTKDNKIGDIIKIIMISPAGAEGINLRNCRQVHILEPYWNEGRIEQVIGRAIRQCHHVDLPMSERTVDVFRYKMVRKGGKESSDEMMENISRRKNNLLVSFIEAIKEVAVDCELFKSHNMMGSKYSCFKFNEDSLFDKHIGPAYNSDIEIDSKMDNGLNSIESIKVKIKVRKVKIVNQIDNIYSDTIYAWLYDNSGVVYNYESNYAIGKISRDENGALKKLDKDTYIVEKTINIPMVKLY